MMRHLSLAFALSAFALFGTACPGCDGEPGADAGPDDGAATAAIAKELCTIYAVGNTNTTLWFIHSFTQCSAEDPFYSPDEETLAAIEESCAPGSFYYDIFVTALEGGRVAIDMDKTRSCVQKSRDARSRTTIFDYTNGEGPLVEVYADPDCQGAITGLVAEGGACEQGWDCAEGLFCEADPPDAAGLRCLEPAGEGELCGGTRTCAEDLDCAIDGTCAPAIAEGGDCANDALERDCVVGTFCDFEDTGLCQPLGGQGDACEEDGMCADELACAFDATGAGTCQTPPASVDDGEPCDAESVCTSYCSVCRPEASGGQTRCFDRGAAGDYCEDDDHCRGGFLCDLGASACVAAPVEELPGLNEPCVAADGCEEGFCANGTCVEGKDGDPCDPDALECAGGFVCQVVASAGTCVTLPAVGEACVDGQCVAYCNGAGQCEAFRGAGASCALDNGGEECLSGTCLPGGTCATPGPSCDESSEWFIQYMTLGLLLPVFARARRRRRASRG